MLPKLYTHQTVGIEALVKWNDGARVFGGCMLLADDMGLGKSRQVIEAAMEMHRRGYLDNVIVVCPASVRSVWYDEELGELAKFHSTSLDVVEYHSKMRGWGRRAAGVIPLTWYVTNYDFVRSRDKRSNWTNLAPLLHFIEGKKNLLVLDESSAVKNYKSLQFKACKRLRASCDRVVLLNGTPISHSPADLYAQAEILNPGILRCKSWFQFRARYAVMGGYKGKQIVNWYNLEDLTSRLRPYVLRREARDCLDLPPRLPPITLTATLTTATWKTYKDLRDELITWLDDNVTASAAQAGVRALRLAQVCSGFLSGLREEKPCECNFEPECLACGGTGIAVELPDPIQIGSEKLNVLTAFLRDHLLDQKALVWCRFRWQVENIMKSLGKLELPIAPLWGNQKREERDKAYACSTPVPRPRGRP